MGCGSFVIGCGSWVVVLISDSKVVSVDITVALSIDYTADKPGSIVVDITILL